MMVMVMVMVMDGRSSMIDDGDGGESEYATMLALRSSWMLSIWKSEFCPDLQRVCDLFLQQCAVFGVGFVNKLLELVV
jgi:hypothetical protein